MNDESLNPAARSMTSASSDKASHETPEDNAGRLASHLIAAAKTLTMRTGRAPPIILDRASAAPPASASAFAPPATGKTEPPILNAGVLLTGVPAINRLSGSSEASPYQSTRPAWPMRPAAGPSITRVENGSELSGAVRTEEENLIAPFVDFEYYRSTYDDVLASNIDPVVHYARYGWKERRNPSRSFNTGFYLDTNPDVAGVDVNPLWHYAVTGRDEGRRAVKPANIGVAILRDLTSPEERTKAYVLPGTVAILNDVTLLSLLAEQTSAAAFVLSVSHDDYTQAVGGTQIFVADEQAKFAKDKAAYLHISPLVARLRLAGADDGTTILRLILNGKPVGFVEAMQLSSALAQLGSDLPSNRLLVCHCLMGHRLDEIIALHRALQPVRAVFWVHDYSSICSSVTLLRNDVTFCGAPPPDSSACRICVHGRQRGEHVARFKQLFAAVAFDVVAPSETALEIWTAHAGLQCRSAVVHPHAAIRFTAARRSLLPIGHRGTHVHPIRIAFAGHPATHKGWHSFSALLDECEKHGEFEFYHFWTEAAESGDPRVKPVTVTVTADARDGMVQALAEHDIDLVLVLSAWPETFSYVTYEAIAAGADVVTFADGGNVAAEVMRSGRGLVMKDYSALLEFFISGSAVRYVRLCYEQGNPTGELAYIGTTATLAGDPRAKLAEPSRLTTSVRR